MAVLLSQSADLTSWLMFFRRYFSSGSSSTIFALVTSLAPKGSPVAVLRVSGRNVQQALKSLNPKKKFEPRKATLSNIYDRENRVIDSAIVTFFKGPSSYTGEDVVEISVHGSKAVVSKLLSTLGEMEGLRPAEPGEFTKRAFLNEKISLTAAEAISDLIESQNESQRERALQAVSGDVQNIYSDWRTQLIDIMAIIEANIDFGEDELIESKTMIEAKERLVNLRKEIGRHLDQVSRRSAIVEQGLQMVIIGRPNVGKSSITNKLASRDVSIVTPYHGTTRDVIETTLDIAGQSITVCDTAGLRKLSLETADQVIEQEGIRRARLKARNCDIIMFVEDEVQIDGLSLDESSPQAELNEAILQNPSATVIKVLNKVDLHPVQVVNSLPHDVIRTSCITNDGITDLMAKIQTAVLDITGQEDVSCSFMNQRHESILNSVIRSLDQALKNHDQDLALTGHHLKKSANMLSLLTGHICSDDVLDVIFSRFCVGK